MKALTFFLFLLPISCSAQGVEVHNCGDGRWTNLPCDKVDTTSPAKKVLTPEEAKNRSQKETILHKIRMKNIEAKRQLEIDFDLTTAEEICQDIQKSVASCRTEVERLEEKLDRRINATALLKQKTEKEKQTTAGQVTTTPQQTGSTTVIIRERVPGFNFGYRHPNELYPNGSGQNQGFGQQIQQNQNVIINQQRGMPVPTASPQSGGSGWRTLP
jgi:hypothetical protein